MKYLTILSLLSVGALAAAVAEPEAEANAAADTLLEKRVDCGRILPVCASGTKIGTAGCQCKGQKPRCDLWACPANRRVGATSSLFFQNSMLLANSVDFHLSDPSADHRYRWFVASQAPAVCMFER